MLGLGRAGQDKAMRGGQGKTIKSHSQSMVAKGSI